MNKKIIFSSLVALAIFSCQAQNQDEKETKHVVKIVTVDDDGNKTVVVKTSNEFSEEELAKFQQLHGISSDVEIKTVNGEKQIFVTAAMDAPEGPFLGIHLAKAENGILITDVVEGSGAEAAGLQKGDILTSFNKMDITSHEDLKNAMANVKVGDKVKLEYLRDSELIKSSATLGEFPEQEYMRKMVWVKDGNEMVFADGEDMELTYDLEELKTKPFLGITPVENAVEITGVMIFEAIKGTSAEKLGLQTGDVIYEINGNNIEDFDGLAAVLKSMKPNDAIEIKYKRDGVKKVTLGNLGSRADGKKAMKFMIKELHLDSDEEVNVDVYLISDDEMQMLSKSFGQNLKNADKMDDVNIEIFPNPNAGNFNLKFNSPEKDAITIKVYNSTGKEVYSKTINDFEGEYNAEIKLENYKSGGYFMVITQKDRVLTEKIIMN